MPTIRQVIHIFLKRIRVILSYRKSPNLSHEGNAVGCAHACRLSISHGKFLIIDQAWEWTVILCKAFGDAR